MNWPLVKAILILPGTVIIYVPTFIFWLTLGTKWEFFLSNYNQVGFWLAAIFTVIGISLAVGSVRQFHRFGDGTPAPWNPPQKLVVKGPYRYVRNPMISGVLFILVAMSLYFQSWPLAGWSGIFFIANVFYFPFSEEKDLEKRFAEEYRIYKKNVPRWVPRLTPYTIIEKSNVNQ